MKKRIDWNTVAFTLLVIVLVKNAALNVASYGSMPDRKNAPASSWGADQER